MTTARTSVSVDPILDPRDEFRRDPAELALRPASLAGRTVLLFGNTQLTTQLPVYGPIFRGLEPCLHDELYGAHVTSVTVHKCEGPHNVLDPRLGPEDLLRTIAAVAATRGGNNAIHPSQFLVISAYRCCELQTT